MKVVVDTSVWSLALRRSRVVRHPARDLLVESINEHRVLMLGPIRQELLSGIRDRRQFERLKSMLTAFPDAALDTADYEQAAEHFNACRARGIQGSNTDFLICAVALRLDAAILAIDDDFTAFARVLPLRLMSAS